MVTLTESQRALLRMFGPDTYGLGLAPTNDRHFLETCGFIEWVPPKFGASMWAITDKGRNAMKGAG